MEIFILTLIVTISLIMAISFGYLVNTKYYTSDEVVRGGDFIVYVKGTKRQ